MKVNLCKDELYTLRLLANRLNQEVLNQKKRKRKTRAEIDLINLRSIIAKAEKKVNSREEKKKEKNLNPPKLDYIR